MEGQSFLVPNAWLLIILAVVVLMEMVAHWRLTLTADGKYDIELHAWRKLFLLMMVVFGAILDKISQVFAPAGFATELISSNLFTKSTLVWLIAAQGLLTLEHIKEQLGRESVPPGLVWFLKQIRAIDAKRWREGHDYADGPPPKRWSDDLTQEDIVALLKAGRRILDMEANSEKSSGEVVDD